MPKTHKIRLEPSNIQATGLSKASGTARFAYNWGLDWWQREYAAHKAGEREKAPGQHEARKALNAIKREQFPWMLESTKCAPQEALINLGRAFENFFKKRGKYPTFKKKGVRDSFKLSSGQFGVEDRDGRWRLRVPNVGWVRLTERPRWQGRFVSATISRRADHWFVSLLVETADSEVERTTMSRTVGVDVGVREYVTSDAEMFQVPRAYRSGERQLRRAQQALCRKQKGSANRGRAKRRVARLHAKTADARSNWLHQMTSRLVRDHDAIAIEDLNIRGMTKNRSLAKSVMDAGFGEFRRQLEYKTAAAGVALVVADRWFGSSKTCSTCGVKTKQRMDLSVREWTCENCGTRHHRDVNAAINLNNLITAGSFPVAACGEFLSAGSEPVSVSAQDASAKQESDSYALSTFV